MDVAEAMKQALEASVPRGERNYPKPCADGVLIITSSDWGTTVTSKKDGKVFNRYALEFVVETARPKPGAETDVPGTVLSFFTSPETAKFVAYSIADIRGVLEAVGGEDLVSEADQVIDSLKNNGLRGYRLRYSTVEKKDKSYFRFFHIPNQDGETIANAVSKLDGKVPFSATATA